MPELDFVHRDPQIPEGTRAAIVQLLATHPKGLHLNEIADRLGLAHPTVLAHLRKLGGWMKAFEIVKTGRIQYKPTPVFRAAWIDPGRAILDQWHTNDAVDWRFPLVCRIPYPREQEFLCEWLDRAQARGILPAHRSRFELQDPKPPLLQIVVYGSCARGDAGPKSDLDLLLYGETGKRVVEGLIGLAHDIALRKDHVLDVRFLDRKGWKDASPAFRAAIQKEGKTVWSSDPDAPFLERPLEATDG